MAKIYHEKDADLRVLKDKTIAIVGWGNQGHAQGENLKDSGLDVIAADLPGSRAWKRAEADGVKAITTSCGFNAVFQRELASALDVPVFTSSLLQVPFVQQIVGERGEVAVITAHKAALKPGHLEAVGITKTEGLHVFGLEECPEWGKMFTDFDAELDLEKIKGEVVGVALEARGRGGEDGRIVRAAQHHGRRAGGAAAAQPGPPRSLGTAAARAPRPPPWPWPSSCPCRCRPLRASA